MSHHYLIDPHEPLVFRDGRPFNAGDRARSLSFPFPSTTAGFLRFHAGDWTGNWEARDEESKRVLGLSTFGPLLLELGPDDHPLRWLAPLPADVLALGSPEDKEQATLHRVVPLEIGDGQTNIPRGLFPVGLRQVSSQSKPVDIARYWYWESLLAWLAFEGEQMPKPQDLGLSGPTPESRMHLEIADDTQAAEERRLFQTSGLEFVVGGEKQERLQKARRLGLLVGFANQLEGGLGSLGGERRLVEWKPIEWQAPRLDSADGILDSILANKACRVMLLTPAQFDGGFRPIAGSRLLQPHGTVRPELKAVAIQRHQVLSGWDMLRHSPKPSQRLAPAGTMLYLTLGDNATPKDIREWAEKMWWHCVSCRDNFVNDGYGLAVLGKWSGQAAELEVSDE